MPDEPVQLRTAFQFSGLDARKTRLAALTDSNPKVARRVRLHEVSRVVEAGLHWLGHRAEPKAIRREFEKQDEGRNSGIPASPLARVCAAVLSLHRQARGHSRFSQELLCELNARMDLDAPVVETGRFRVADGRPEYPGHQPFSPDAISGALTRSIDWFESDGAAQLHPLERSVLVLARLAEIAPFARANLPTLTLASSYYLAAAGYSLPAFFVTERASLSSALSEAAGMKTQPLIDLYVKMEIEVLEELLSSAE